MSRKGDRALFGSNWREGMAVVTNVDAYVSDFRAFVSLWAGASDAGNGWKWLAWFGYFKDPGNGWIWHAEHGWMYYGAAATTSSMWLWNSRLGWLWTQDSLYPYLWSSSLNTWLWYYRGTGNGSGGWFYNFLGGGTQWR